MGNKNGKLLILHRTTGLIYDTTMSLNGGMVFDATFNNISVAVSFTGEGNRTEKTKSTDLIGTDCIGSCKSNYQTITTMTVPSLIGSRYIISNIQKEVPQSDDIDDILNINFLKIGKE